MKVLLPIFGLVVFILSAIFGYYLLRSGQLSGAEFVSFTIAFAAIGLIISFSSEIQEFSIAGNIVKLKEVKKDAENSIVELKAARTETFRYLLSLSKRRPGGFMSNGTVDDRVKDFWFLYDQIIRFNGKIELAQDIYEVVFILVKGQLNQISSHISSINKKYNNSDTVPVPSQLLIEVIDNDSIQEAVKRNVLFGSVEKIKKELIKGIEE